MQIIKELEELLGNENLFLNEPMKFHTTFQIGGPARIFTTPNHEDQIIQIMDLCKKEGISYYVMGKGSNLLVKDEGYDGVIIQIGKKMSYVRIEGTDVIAGSGAMLLDIANDAMEAGLSGLEFASGIPGTAGGAVVMNAGAYGGQMDQVIKQIRIIDRFGKIQVLSNQEVEFSYRDSIVKREKLIVTEVVYSLHPEAKEKIKEIQSDFTARREEKQPLSDASAGSTFQRPEGYFAGKLIMDAGLRGFSIGGAQVSEKHCGFVINKGDATAKDVKELITYIQNEVYKQFSVHLHPEVIYLDDQQ